MSQSRQLAVIMFTDIVGYTALMGQDEQRAFELLDKNRQIQKPIIEKHSGRWIKELGDGVMASFNTVSDAVNAAIKIQQECNASEQFQLRIGIHLGEVVFENDDVFGDGVNIASRIQKIADPGSIYVSEPVQTNITNKKGVHAKFVRPEIFKNVKDAVNIYEVFASDQEPHSHEVSPRAKPTLEDSFAVLPFINISNDPEQEYFSDGIAEEIIANLSKLRDIKVVSRTTSMQYKNTKKDIKTIGRELSVAFILEGSVRKFHDNLRITAQLIDVRNDIHLWAESFNGKMDDVFDIQEQVSKKIVAALMVTLSPAEKVGLTKRSTFNAEAYDCYLRARNFLYRLTKSNVIMAIQLFEKAIDLDGKYAYAYAGLSESYATLYNYFERNENYLEKAIESGLKALLYDPNLGEAYAALGLAYFNKRSLNEAMMAGKKAVEIDPANFIGYWLLGDIYHQTDEDEKALEMYQKVIELNPLFCPAYGNLRMMFQRLGRRSEYNKILEKALQYAFPEYLSRHPDDPRGHMYFAIESAEAGYMQLAHEELSKAMALSSDDPRTLYSAACFYAMRNEKKKAIEVLRQALAGGYSNYEWIKRDPDVESIRDDPEFLELMKNK